MRTDSLKISIASRLERCNHSVRLLSFSKYASPSFSSMGLGSVCVSENCFVKCQGLGPGGREVPVGASRPRMSSMERLWPVGRSDMVTSMASRDPSRRLQ